jgi:hypothetical protein
MFGRHEAVTKQRQEVLPIRQDADSDLRDEVDPDPLIEEMVERLRTGLGSLVALDEWGRPVAWRQVVRIAAGPSLAALRDAQTAVALAQAATQQRESAPTVMPEPVTQAEPVVDSAAPTEQLLPRPTWTYESTATGWVAAPTSFGLRQIDLDAHTRPGYATPAERSEV